MKLLVVSHPCVIDVNQRIYRELELMNHEVAIVVPNRWRHEYSAGEFRPARLPGFSGPLIPMRILRAGSVPLHAYIGHLRAVLTRVAPDAIYLEQEPYSVAAFQWSLAASRSSTQLFFFTAQNLAKKYPLPFRLSERYVWSRSAAAVCVTESIARNLVARGYRGDTFVVPHAVDVSAFDGEQRDTTLRDQLGLKSLVIAYLGRLVEEKGLKVLLEAYRRLPRRESTSLLCIGAGPLGDMCRAEPGAVVVEGVRHSDVPKYLALADLLALPSLTTSSWKEQFGRAAIEAMACGLPVVGSDSGEIPALITEAGGGTLVPEGNTDALTNELARLLEDKPARMRLADLGRTNVRALYSTQKVAARLAAALRLTQAD